MEVKIKTREEAETMVFPKDEMNYKISDEAIFKRFVADFEGRTERVSCNLKQLTTKTVVGDGFFIPDIREECLIPENISDEAVEDTVNSAGTGSNGVVILNGRGYLLSKSAYTALADKIGVNCPAFTKIPIATREKWMNEAIFAISDKKITLIMRDDKIRGIASDRYQVVPQSGLFDESLKYFKSIYDDVAFDYAIISHEMTEVHYYVLDCIALNKYKRWLKDIGFEELKDAHLEIVIQTSDTTDSAVRLSLALATDRLYMGLGSPIAMPHLYQASLSKWQEKIKPINAHVESLIGDLKRLNTVELRYPRSVFVGLCYDIGLSKKAVANVIDDFSRAIKPIKTPTAHDVYYGIYDVLAEMLEKEEVAKQAYVRYAENLVRAIHPSFDWKRLDISEVI